jgi:hypothetical protein
MRSQPGFFDVDERLKDLSALGVWGDDKIIQWSFGTVLMGAV